MRIKLMNRHTTKTRLALRTVLAATISVGALGFVSAPAFAEKKAPAPIVYAGQGGSNAASSRTRSRSVRTQSTRSRTATASSAPVTPSTAGATGKRVEFRYPDQPDRFYGAGGATTSAADAPPLSFSSAETAISEAAARQYANTEAAPLTNVAKDPAITAGGFDARAAAARNSKPAARVAEAPVSAPPAAAPITSAPLPPPGTAYKSSAGFADFGSAQITQVQARVEQPVAEAPVSGAVQNPAANAVYDQTGTASVIDADLHGQPTANGEILDLGAMTAAHPTLPLPSLVQVINLENNTEMVVRVNDRGPFEGNGLIELSERAADVIGMRRGQPANVRVRYLGPAPVAEASAPVQRPANASSQPERDGPAFVPGGSVVPELAGGRPQSIAPQTAAYDSRSSVVETGSYYVQLGSFSNIGNAQGLHAKVASTANVNIVPVRVNGADFFRVMAGPVGNSQDAELLRSYIANQGIADGVVVNPR